MLKGIWFFGMSGVGKTYSSRQIFNKINNNNNSNKFVLIDADLTRKYINFDSGYSIKDRETVIKRNLGLALICIASGCFPIVCTVYMNNTIGSDAIKNGIKLIKINREMNNVVQDHPTYKNDHNVVGVDIHYPNFNFDIKKINNTLDQRYTNIIDNIVDELKSN